LLAVLSARFRAPFITGVSHRRALCICCSGKKKTVPYTLDTLTVGATCVIASWGLCPGDVCFNMMPLFHVGGIVRNLLSPILSGGATVLAPGFDAVQFWDCAGSLGVTW
jgi:acyl-CoA synthetase (AMP-forming)/AMP-acid ligase II